MDEERQKELILEIETIEQNEDFNLAFKVARGQHLIELYQKKLKILEELKKVIRK